MVVWDQGTQQGYWKKEKKNKAESGGKRNAVQHFDPFSGLSRPHGATVIQIAIALQ